MATPGHPEPLSLENHVYIIALTPDLQRVSFYSITDFLLTPMQEIVISLVAAVARKFMHDRHADLYLDWRRLTIFGLEQNDFG
jgi:hypothetical protein